MKKLYLYIIVLFSFIANADCQVINNGEYFFDIDSGQGRGTAITITANDTVSLSNIAVNTAGLINGYHFLYVRVKESNGTWSHCRRQRFYVFDNSPIVPVLDSVVLKQAEYWIDSVIVPGTGRLISLPAKDTLFYNDSIPGLQLDSGAHRVSVRVKDSKGNWSQAKTDSVRVEYYDVIFNVKIPPFIRRGFKSKFTITITNHSSVDIVERYIVMQSPKDFTAEFRELGDTINGVPINNISKTVFVNGVEPHYEMPLWVGKLPKQHSVTYNFYVTFPLLSREPLKLSYQLWGDDNSDMELLYKRFGIDSTIFTSLYAGALLNSINLIKDTLGLHSLNYKTINDSLSNWLKKNNNKFKRLMPINVISKTFLENVFNANLNDFQTNQINSLSLFGAKQASYNTETADAPPQCPSTVQPSCDCITSIPFSQPPVHPLDNENCFYIKSGCQKRCKCECKSGTWQRVDEVVDGVDRHIGVDLVIKKDAPCYSKDWEDCKIPVRAMYEGDALGFSDPLSAHIVEVTSHDANGAEFRIQYAHLCDKSSEPFPNQNPDGVFHHVRAGEIIGYVGRTGRPTEIHLHINGFYQNGCLMSPYCLMDFKTVYPPLDPYSALVDQPCKPLNACEKNGSCDSNSKTYYARSGYCKAEWLQTEKCKGALPVTGADPNDKVGNEGFTPQRFIKKTDQLHYGIFFENVDTATAAAQVVTIVDTLDLTKVDKHSFYLESITAGEMLVVLPDSIRLQNLDSIYKEKPVNGTYVRIQATFDTTTGIVKFVLTSLDTATLQPVTDVLAGFLPPDTTKFDGNGLVSYKIMPVSNIPGNTVITNKAYIIFDTNPAIVTGTWFNTIDGTKPSSQVNVLPSISYDSSFSVRWSGTDNESGIVAYDVYYKTSGTSNYKQWLNYIADTSAVFTGNYDSTYQFYSIGYDSVLNMEDPPITFDAITHVKKPLEDSLCNGGSISFGSGSPTGVTAYQWQVDNGSGFTNLFNSAIYNGATNDTLKLTALPSSLYGYKYRCVINKSGAYDTSIVHVIHFVNHWTGAVSTAWENAANWSCNSLPDGNTDVFVNGIITNAPVINSEAICRSLFLNPGIPFKVNPNHNLTITH